MLPPEQIVPDTIHHDPEEELQMEPVDITLDNTEEDEETTASVDMYIQGATNLQDTGVVYTSPSNWFVNTINTILLTCLEEVVKTTVTNGLAPTQASRILYIWFFTVSSGYNWIRETTQIKGTNDNWNWDLHYPLTKPRDIQSWIVHMLVYVMPNFVPNFKTNTLLENERTMMRISHEDQIVEWQRISILGNWNGWMLHWKGWFERRQADNSLFATAPPSMDSLPNKQLFLNTFMKQDMTKLYQPTKWTPLIVQGVQYPFVTYDWGTVRSSTFTAEDETAILAKVDEVFPSEGKRTIEVAELLAIAADLTDDQKVSAEFWLQTSVPLPCFFIMMWRGYVANTVDENNMDLLFLSGLELATNMFEASRLLWTSKSSHMQSCPIQDIRRLYNNNTITSWDSTKGDIEGGKWVPFYDQKLITPACPDFPSEQSAFAEIFASIMSQRFTPEIKPFAPQTIPIITTEAHPFGTFIVRKGTSTIQPGLVPKEDITLSWSTWKNMANSCGLAAKYGGIHTSSSHFAGQALANEVVARIRTTWFREN